MAYRGIYKNHLAAPKNASLNIRTGPGTNHSVLANVPKGKGAGVTTGNIKAQRDGQWFEIRTLTRLGLKNVTGWVRQDVIQLIDLPVKKNDGELLINQILKNDIQSIDLAHEIALKIQSLKNRGFNTAKAEKMTNTILKGIKQRQDSIKNSPLIRVRSGAKKAWQWIQKKTGINGIGEPVTLGISAVSIVVISAVLLVGGAAIYAAYIRQKKPAADAVNKLTALNNALDRVDPKTAKEVKKEVQGALEDAYQAGTGFGFLKNIKEVTLLGVFGFLGYKLLN